MCLKGKLGFKGERGYSAYEIAVQNGFEGSEQDWLATLGTSSHFQQNKVTYTTETANETTFDLPTTYTSNCFVDVYVEGERLNSDEYTINTTTNKVILTTPLEVIGTKVEIVMITMSTNNLPIVDTIDSESTNDTAPGTKATFDFVNSFINGKYALLTGNTNKAALHTDINYPDGFNKNNCIVMSLMIEESTGYYYRTKKQGTSQDYDVNVQLGNDIVIWESYSKLENNSFGYKILLMKVGEENE